MLWAKSTALSSTFTQVVLWHISILWEREEASMSDLEFLPRRHPGLQLHGSKSIHFCDFWVLGAYGRCGTPPQQSISDGYSTAHFNRDKLPRSQLILTIILSALLTYLLGECFDQKNKMIDVWNIFHQLKIHCCSMWSELPTSLGSGPRLNWPSSQHPVQKEGMDIGCQQPGLASCVEHSTNGVKPALNWLWCKVLIQEVTLELQRSLQLLS